MPDLDQAGRKIYSTSEYREIDVPLVDLLKENALDVYPEVVGKQYFQIGHDGPRIRFMAGGKVGLIPINSRVAIDVAPRVPANNLERVLRIAEVVPAGLTQYVRRYAMHEDPAPSLLRLFAEALLEGVSGVIRNGLYREYEPVTEVTSFPRGRFLMRQTVTRSVCRNEQHRVTASWFRHTVDVGPNQCIKYALRAVCGRLENARAIAGQRRLLRELNAAYHSFDGVSLNHEMSFLQHPLVASPRDLPANRLYYRSALQISVNLLRDRGISFSGHRDDILMSSLIIDMADVFESYLRLVLISAEPTGSPFVVLNGNHFGRPLLAGGSTLATPDIVLKRSGGSCAGLIEVKYKPRKNPDRDDLNQAIAYGASYASPYVVLAYPTEPGGQSGLTELGRCEEISLFRYAFDLGTEDIALEERAFAQAVFGLIGTE